MAGRPAFQPERPVLEHILIYVAYAGYGAEVRAVLYGACNRAQWEDDDLHAAVLGLHHGPRKRTCLMAAASAGDVPLLTRLLHSSSGALRGRTNVNGVGSRGWTALHWAAHLGKAAAVRMLTAAGAASGVVDAQGSTVLHWAADDGNAAIVEVLLAAGAAVGATNLSDATPLHLAARKGHTACVWALLAGGAAVDASDEVGGTPLHDAAHRGHTAALQALLAAKGVALRATDIYGSTPLHLAAQGGHTAAVQALLAAGAATDARTDDGATPCITRRTWAALPPWSLSLQPGRPSRHGFLAEPRCSWRRSRATSMLCRLFLRPGLQLRQPTTRAPPPWAWPGLEATQQLSKTSSRRQRWPRTEWWTVDGKGAPLGAALMLGPGLTAPGIGARA